MMTKAEEREVLRNIAGLIESTEPGSYIRMAFAGCVQMAEDNIRDDFGNSYPDLIASKEKQIEKLAAQLRDWQHDANSYQKDYMETLEALKDKEKTVEEQAETLRKLSAEKAEMRYDFGCMESLIDAKDAEIQKLKAEIMRMRIERMTEKEIAYMYDSLKEGE